MGGSGGGPNGERPKENGFHHTSLNSHHNGIMNPHNGQAGPSTNGLYSSIASGGKNYPPIGSSHNGLHNDRSLMNGAAGGSPLMLNAMMNGGAGLSIAKPEMCYFCFDVLYCHLFHLDPPNPDIISVFNGAGAEPANFFAEPSHAYSQTSYSSQAEVCRTAQEALVARSTNTEPQRLKGCETS